MEQQDVHELLCDLLDLLDLANHEEFAITQGSQLSLKKDDKTLLGREPSLNNTCTIQDLTLMNAPPESTLQSCLNTTLEPEVLTTENALSWSREELVKAQLLTPDNKASEVSNEERAQATRGCQDVKQCFLAPLGQTIPQRMLLKVDLNCLNRRRDSVIKDVQASTSLMKDLNQTVSVTFYHGTAQQPMSERQAVTREYWVQSAICHTSRAGSGKRGHYVAMSRCPKPTLLDDLKITPWPIKGSKPYTGRIFSLKAVNQTASTIS